MRVSVLSSLTVNVVIEKPSRETMHTGRAIPGHQVWPKNLAAVIKASIVKVNDAQILAHTLLPMGGLG